MKKIGVDGKTSGERVGVGVGVVGVIWLLVGAKSVCKGAKMKRPKADMGDRRICFVWGWWFEYG